MAEKNVKVKVDTDVDASKVESLEKKLRALKLQKIRQTLDMDMSQLNQVETRIKSLQEKINRPVAFGMSIDKINEAKAEIESLKQQQIALEIAVNTDKLEEAKAKIDDLDNTSVDIDINQAMQNVGVGITQVNNATSELIAGLGEVQQAGIQSEQNLAFLEKNLGPEKAKQTYQEIADIVAKMPGDDNTMRSVLSTAQAMGNNLNADEMTKAAGTMADYMSGSATMGKQAIESQQDIMKYLLDGNTAELERGSIVSSRVDKLKEATTFQERQAAMQEVLNELGYGGIANMDTTLKKQMEWEGMMYNSKDALSQLWLGAEKGAMGYIMDLNEATGGILGMGIAAGQVAIGPVTELFSGLGEVGLGLKTLRDFTDWSGLTDGLSKVKTALLDVGRSAKTSLLNLKNWGAVKFDALKTSLMGVATKAKDAALALLDLGKKALLAGYNALKTVAMWTAKKVAMIADTVATQAAALAEWALNAAIWANPLTWFIILLVAVAAALIWAYYNVDSFRQKIDEMAQVINGAISWVMGLFNNFTSSLGLNTNDWVQAIIGFILFLPTLPLQVGIALVNTIARLLGFKGNFVQTMQASASNAVNNFLTYLSQLPGKAKAEFERIKSLAQQWAAELPKIFWDAGVNAVKNFLDSLGIHSPGYMFYAVQGELNRMDDLTKNTEIDTGRLGDNMVAGFNPDFATSNNDISSLSNNSITINIESVDNEERIQQIVRAVEEALRFDNETAGRSV